MKTFMQGAEAIAFAAAESGLEAYFGYPITPSSEIMENLAAIYEKGKYGNFRVFFQTSSEIESINMLFGAGASGHIAMTATSGPGLSLMAEGISYSFLSQVPFLIIDVNRGGPGLGNVEPEQSDLSFVYWSLGHGGTRVIAMSPFTVSEAMTLVKKGFELAFKYRMPAVMLTDGVIVHMYENISWKTSEPLRPEVSWSARGRGNGPRHEINSIYLEPKDLRAVKGDLLKKLEALKKEAAYECYYCDGPLDALYISYGISARIALDAVRDLRRSGIRAGLFRPITIYPFAGEALANVAKMAKKLVTVEMNEGQMAKIIKAETGLEPEGLGYLGGEVPRLEEVMEAWR